MPGSVCQDLTEGVACHADGRLEEAARFYTAVLERDPRNSDAWHLMGRVWFGKGDFDSAAACVVKAVRLRPDLPAFHSTLGDILAALGRRREAELCYQVALRADPRFEPSLINLGNLLQKEGRFQEAAAVYVRAIEADTSCAEAFNNLGNVLGSLGRGREAAECFREAFRLHPDSPDAPVNLAAWCLGEHNAVEAEEWARVALHLQPGLTPALSNLSLSLLSQDRSAEAEAPAREALAQAPLAPHLHANLGSVLLRQQRWAEAEQACRRALEIQPGHPEAALNLGVALQFSGRFDKAAAQYEQVLAAQPRSADAWTNLGTVREAQSLHDDAFACFEEALEHDSTHAKAHFCHSLELLARGRLAEGFKEFEWRWKMLRNVPRASVGPAWQGEALEGRTILLSAEQGLGDTIQFARYIPLLAALGGRVIVESQPAAAPIVRSIAGVAAVITPEDPLPVFEVQAAMMSLPRIFRTGLDSIPGGVPYVPFDRDLAAELQVRLGIRRGLRAGLCWSGNPLNKGDVRRSMPVEAMLPLRDIPGAEWFSLHVGEKASREARQCGGWIREVLSEMGGLPELAALLSCLDLIVTVDTMPAHLAGAMGRPVWNLLCHAPDWRWMREREDSPWYPSMRLFRQPVPGDWAGVVRRVAAALAEIPIQGSFMEADTLH